MVGFAALSTDGLRRDQKNVRKQSSGGTEFWAGTELAGSL
jgi:hypothetical protein